MRDNILYIFIGIAISLAGFIIWQDTDEDLGVALRVTRTTAGGTATSTRPLAGDFLMSQVDDSYGPATFLPGNNITLASSTDSQGRGTLTITGTSVASDPNVIIVTVGQTAYLRGSTTRDWLFTDGFVSQASSTITSTLTMTGDLILTDNDAVALGTGSDSRLYYDGTDTFLDLHAAGTGDLMIALAGSFPSPDPIGVHIWRGDAGAVAANGDAILTIERDGFGFFQVLSTDTDGGGLLVGSPTGGASRGSLLYRRTDDRWEILTAGGNRLFISANAFAFQEATTISTIANNNLTITAGGTGDLLLTADSDTNVGIGTSTPGTALSVVGNINATGYFIAPDIIATSSLTIGTDSITDITGTNLSISAGVLNASGGAAFAWTPTTDGVSTSTLLEFRSAFLSTGSSTMSNPSGTTTVTGSLRIDGTGLIYDRNTGNLGLGAFPIDQSANDRPQLYIFHDDTGTQQCDTGSHICIKSSNNAFVSFMNKSNDASLHGIRFGDQSSDNVGGIIYQHSTDELSLRAGGFQILTLDSTLFEINEDNINMDTKISGDNDDNLFFLDAGTDRIGIGKNAPSFLLDIDGDTSTIELRLPNSGTSATAANEVRLGGFDLSAGDAGLLLTTENDTDHLFASLVGLGTTTPRSSLQVDAGVSATTTFELGDLFSGTGKACFNVAQADGSVASFFFAGGAIVIETNVCQQ